MCLFGQSVVLYFDSNVIEVWPKGPVQKKLSLIQ